MSHDAGLTSICYAQRDGKSVLLSVGQDGKLLLRDPLKVATVLHTFDLKQPMHDVHSLQVDGKPCALVAQQDGYAKVELMVVVRRCDHPTITPQRTSITGIHPQQWRV